MNDTHILNWLTHITYKYHCYTTKRCWCWRLTGNNYPWWWRQYAPLKRRSTIILHGSITQKTALNIILAAVRTWNFSLSLRDTRRHTWPTWAAAAEFWTVLRIYSHVTSSVSQLQSFSVRALSLSLSEPSAVDHVGQYIIELQWLVQQKWQETDCIYTLIRQSFASMTWIIEFHLQ
jgi:hypothetical protein